MVSEKLQGVSDLMPQVSIVVPMHNEEGAAAKLIHEICSAAQSLDAFEIVVVDDGSTDQTLARLVHARQTATQLRILRHTVAGGQSAAVHSGVTAARAAVCVTLDGDGQNPPSDLPLLWRPLLDDPGQKIGLVAGQRVGRQDTQAKKLASRFANTLRGWMLKDGTRDAGCGMKGFRRETFLALPYFNHMHRYLPALFKAQGWRIVHVDVSHAPRQSGQSKYTNIGRAAVGVWDLLGVAWLIKRAKTVRPEDETS
ncbi:glycosyltransferase family 2 protein [Roseobacter sp. OBYS 0001]|uniref:glycosyltransferase family 2 protein n=1 Tax=Roseobacter sp. OBYS 0001 TaxID=882651 RepID=UPI001BB92668|nr:glycosyltransferase family 2 protein [Roseobacter sp. OBYS 0001]GIT86653.1 dolichol-phosphate mannosyltransferase [Roseobacter sp. OBYS 0001]